jgi:hypothetical protein
MKKIYFSILSLCLGLSVNAQVTALTQANHFHNTNDSTRATDAGTFSVAQNPGGSGTGQTWNFASITTGTTITKSYGTTVPSGSAAAFPNANLAVKVGSDHTLFKTSATSLEFHGGNLSANGVSVLLDFNTPAVYATYPLGYGTNATNAVAGDISIFGQTGTFTGNVAFNGDGSGTLLLPGQTFNNVLRVATTSTLNFSVFMGFVTGTVFLETFEYYDVSKFKTALFTISNTTVTSSSSPTSVNSIMTVNTDALSVGVKENLKSVSDVRMFPNPAKGHVNLSFTNDNSLPASCEIINALGQTLRRENLGNEKGNVKHSLNIENLDSGIYFIKLTVGPGVSVQKLTIQ